MDKNNFETTKIIIIVSSELYSLLYEKDIKKYFLVRRIDLNMTDPYDPEEDKEFINALISSYNMHGYVNFDNLCAFEEYNNLFLDETY